MSNLALKVQIITAHSLELVEFRRGNLVFLMSAVKRRVQKQAMGSMGLYCAKVWNL